MFDRPFKYNFAVFQLIILALQLVLMRGQLMLSEKIDKDSKKRDKGYFIIGETNFPYDVEKEPIDLGTRYLEGKASGI